MANFTDVRNPMVVWAKDNKQVEICAFDYPGRDKLLKAKKHESIDTLAPELLAVFYEKMNDGVPYIIWGHSVGTWVSFEFLMLARKIGLPMPKAAFLNAFPAPHMPVAMRPWRMSRLLSSGDLKEEVKLWDTEHFE